MISAQDLVLFAAAALVMVLTPGPNNGRAWEIEIVLRRDPWWQRWVRAWRQDRQARMLAQLDKRILEDIGMGPGSNDPVAAHAHEYRQQEMRRIAIAKLGLL